MANLTKRPSERKGEIVARPVVLKGKGERNAMSTSIATVQKEFLIEQEVKGNSKDTLKYYRTPKGIFSPAFIISSSFIFLGICSPNS